MNSEAEEVEFHDTTEEKTEPVLCIRKDWALQLVEGGFDQSVTEQEGRHLLDYREMHVIPRHHAERDPSFLQIIPYAILTQGTEMYGYQRSGSERRLVGNGSIGFGGHITFEDISDTASKGSAYIDPQSAIGQGLAREIREEMGVPIKTMKPVATLYDAEDEVGQVHLGIVHIVEIPAEAEISPSDEIASVLKGTPEDVFEGLENPEGWTDLVEESGLLTDPGRKK